MGRNKEFFIIKEDFARMRYTKRLPSEGHPELIHSGSGAKQINIVMLGLDYL